MALRVRFAPSPTGHLHVGNARTALFNYLFARHNGGTFVLRIEDTDIERHDEGALEKIYKCLRWMGIEWDEGPDIGGAYGPYRQSERMEIYRKFAEKLKTEGLAYECYCTPEELSAVRERQLKQGKPPRYPGTCRKLSSREKERLKREGRKPVLRFKVPEDRNIAFHDLVRGDIEINSAQLGGDFVILRSSGIPVYNFAVVVDDALMRITHVIRGEDHIPNTPKQLLLYEALGFEPPLFAHLPMILGTDRSKLSKRHGSTSVEEFMEKGYLSQAFTNFIALLGWYPKDGKEILSLAELVERFELKDVSRAPAVFDTAKLNWMNQVYMRNCPVSKLTELIIPFLERAGYSVSGIDRHWLEMAVSAVRDYMVTLSDAGKALDVFLNDDIRVEQKALEFILEKESRLRLIEALLKEVEKVKELKPETFKRILKNIGKELKLKGKELFMPVRIALTGKTEGVDINLLVPLLGRERVLKRLTLTLKQVEGRAR
jgi:glutamyl-tRNA synthetase